MSFRITFEPDHLRAELTNGQTAAEMRDFLRAVARDSARCATILIRMRGSKPLFHAERDGLIDLFQQMARAPDHRIALLADNADQQASHEYLELIARQRGVRVRSFRSETEVQSWLRDRRDPPDRRLGIDRRLAAGGSGAVERRHAADRRQGGRRTLTGD